MDLEPILGMAGDVNTEFESLNNEYGGRSDVVNVEQQSSNSLRHVTVPEELPSEAQAVS